MGLTQLPWALLKTYFQKARRRYFSRAAPDHPYLFVRASIDEVEQILAHHHFASWNKLAYYYEGEDLNMRRIEYIDDDGNWWQTHVRVFKFERNHAMLKVHLEKCPVEHPVDHLDMEGYDPTPGFDVIERVMTDAGVQTFGHSWVDSAENVTATVDPA